MPYLSEMQHQEFEPPEALRDIIRCFWHDTRDVRETHSSFEVVPDGYAEIIFYFGNLRSISYGNGLQPLPSPFVMGLLNRPIVFYMENHVEIIGVRCFPWAIFDLLGLSSGKGGVQIFEHPIANLQRPLRECVSAGKIEEAIALLREYFLNMDFGAGMDSMLFKAGVAMNAANGTLPVSQVAAAANATVRTLERKFKHSSGHAVKDVSALMRFEQVRNRLWINPGCSLAGLALELGYADQSHLSREFKRFSGTTPGAFARRSKKGKLAVSSDFVAFVQA